MDITLRAAGANATGTSSVTCNQPTGTLADDVLIAFIVDHSVTDGQSAAPTGWQARGYTRNVGGRRFQVFTAVVGKNSLTGTSWTFSGLTTRSQGMIIGYYNANTTGYGGFDTSISVRDNASGIYGTLGITTATDGAMIVAAFCSYVAATTYAWTSEHCDTIGNLAERFDNKNSTYCSLAVADLLLATAGPTGESGATPTTGQNNGGILLALKPGATVYDETGKLQTVLAVQGRSDAQGMSETAKVQNILTAQGRSDMQSMLETAKMQVVLVAQGESDGFLFNETGLAQIILAVQGRSDQVIASETGKLAVVLAAQGKTDLMQMIESARLQVILAAQGRQDAAINQETAKTEIILAVQGEADGLLYTETGLIQAILALQGKTDHQIIGELAKLAVVLVAQGNQDVMTLPELGKEEVILAIMGHQDTQNMLELESDQIILAAQGVSDILTLAELAKEQVILATQGRSDSYTAGETGKEVVALAVLGEFDSLIPHGGGNALYSGGFASENRFNHHGYK